MFGPMDDWDDEVPGYGLWVLGGAVAAAVAGAFQVWRASIERDAAVTVAKIERKSRREQAELQQGDSEPTDR